MDTIIVYLDNMFSGLPKTAELAHLKQELLSGMEEKYQELKRDGKSENEAIGIVISEFGNIEELTAALGIHPTKSNQTVPMLTKEEVYAYMRMPSVAPDYGPASAFFSVHAGWRY